MGSVSPSGQLLPYQLYLPCIKELGGRLRRWVGILPQPPYRPISGLAPARFQHAKSTFAMARGLL